MDWHLPVFGSVRTNRFHSRNFFDYVFFLQENVVNFMLKVFPERELGVSIKYHGASPRAFGLKIQLLARQIIWRILNGRSNNILISPVVKEQSLEWGPCRHDRGITRTPTTKEKRRFWWQVAAAAAARHTSAPTAAQGSLVKRSWEHMSSLCTRTCDRMFVTWAFFIISDFPVYRNWRHWYPSFLDIF